MINIQNAFKQLLQLKGKTVTIIHHTPHLDDQEQPILDNKNRPTYNETEITTTANITTKQTYEKQEGYIDTPLTARQTIAMFEFKDSEYLNKRNTLQYFDATTGMYFEYQMKDIIPCETHIEVILE